ncbi:hypothetical protein BTO18_10305 [Polaribacter porphyrae]|uniref:Uncharacterized protein n=1 Tax=Polaribacter porphyrae TaxID=1137780 RepID=A0A2S7WPJ9_9FLAO|nr:hypothetical protein BTO18_10305 [Polaribacter porphyrae]
MSFSDNLKQLKFWKLFINFVIPFFLFVTVFSLLINSFSDVFSGNFSEVNTTNFTDGKWKIFFTPKVILSLVYGFYMANKNMKLKKRL